METERAGRSILLELSNILVFEAKDPPKKRKEGKRELVENVLHYSL